MVLSRRRLPIVVQSVAVVAGMAVFAFWPPDRGALLLIPVAGRTADPINVALAADAALLGAGPLRGSIVVEGDRARIAAVARAAGATIVSLAAPRSMCAAAGQSGTRT